MATGGHAPIPILYCIDSLPPSGGTEGQLAGLLERLDRARFQPHLCTLRPEAPLRPLPTDCPHLSLDVPKLLGPAAWRESRRLARYLRDHRIQVVQTFFQDATVFGIWTARLAGVPVRLISFRDLGFWRERKIEFLMRRTYPLATAFVVNSQAVRDHFTTVDGLDARRFHIIGNGLDTDRIPFHADPDTPPRVVLVGNLNRAVKRADLFVRAAALARPRCPDARWQLIGDGHLRPGLEALAQELGVADRVDFLGRQDNVADCLRGAAVGVNCSDSEGFSNAVLEYMLAGCAVVATAIGGNSELVRDGVDGRLVPVGDADALAAAVAGVLGDPEGRRQMVVTARRRVEEEYAWVSCVGRTEGLYGEFLGSGACSLHHLST